jgi:hypothetical protein
MCPFAIYLRPQVEVPPPSVDGELRFPTHQSMTYTTNPMTQLDDWPKPPIWPEDLEMIRQLMTGAEYVALLRRLIHVLPDGPLVDQRRVFGAPSTS